LPASSGCPPCHSARISVCTSPRPAQASFERLKGEQHPAQDRSRPPRAARQQGDPPVVAREDVDDQAGLAVRVGMQDESRLPIDPVPLVHPPTRSPVIGEPAAYS
jgi:hypothetical protein